MRKALLCVALLIAGAIAPALAARGDEGDWELGVYVGQAFPDDYESATFGLLEPEDDTLFGARIGWFLTPRGSIEFSGQRLETTLDLNGEEARLDSYRLNYLWNFRPGEAWRPFLTLGAGLEAAESTGFESDDLGVNAGGGVRWFLGDHFGLRLDGRVISTDVGSVVDERQTNFEATLGATWAFGGGPPPDSDGDGVVDRDDKCPDTPRGAKVDAVGCPTDADGDGVLDPADKCPNTPRGEQVGADGCPPDSDGDGVNDGTDQCPDSPRGMKVGANGCPPDADGDGVPDAADRCPDSPRGSKVDAAGCPPDSDGDGVIDPDDRCPNTERGARVNASGCVEPVAPLQRTLVLEGVNFETDSARLLPESTAVLDRVVERLKENPDVRIAIDGHTDSTGGASHNQALSEARAASVRDYFVSKGIAAARLTSRGYGGTKPVASNDTAAGRARNRRVELNRLD